MTLLHSNILHVLVYLKMIYIAGSDLLLICNTHVPLDLRMKRAPASTSCPPILPSPLSPYFFITLSFASLSD